MRSTTSSDASKNGRHYSIDIFHLIVEANEALERWVHSSTEDGDLSTTEVDMWKKAFIQELQKSEKAEQEARLLRARLASVQRSTVS